MTPTAILALALLSAPAPKHPAEGDRDQTTLLDELAALHEAGGAEPGC